MCGIAGLYSPSIPLQTMGNGAQIVRNMTQSFVHRGPDADGLWVDEQQRCILGHRRLSIIDISDAGRQPMSSVDGRWEISFNGEIYNFQDIRRDLQAKSVVLRGRTDTEVLLESIALWGVAALPKLDGMYAFAAFDVLTGELLLARDPFGEKPLYYMELAAGGLAFASELQAFEKVPGFDAAISADALAEVLMFQYIGAPRSIYESVKKLPPGHWMRLVPGRAPEIKRYFTFEPGAKGFTNRPMAQLADELEEILVRSLERRLVADVPLGAFLSGGVDSSTVCALARRKLDVPLKTFSIGFAGDKESEHEIARQFAAHLGTQHHDKIISPSAVDFLNHAGTLLDEPNADSSCLPTYYLSEFARQHVTVALSGDGGDELFGGYGRYLETLREAGDNLGGRWSPGSAYYSGRILVFPPNDLARFFGFLPTDTLEHRAALIRKIDSGGRPLLCLLRETDVENYMPGAVLPKVDRMSMQHSLEVRTPFLNLELARFAETLPPRYLVADGRGKVLLKEIAYRYLPRELIDMPKKGFGLPLDAGWGQTQMVAALRESLGMESRLGNWIGKANAQEFLARQSSDHGFSMYQSWAVVMLERWLRERPAEMPKRETVRACPYVPGHGLSYPDGRRQLRYFQWVSPIVLLVSPPMHEELGDVTNIYEMIGWHQKASIDKALDAAGLLASTEHHQAAFPDFVGKFSVSVDVAHCPPDLAVVQGLKSANINVTGKVIFLVDAQGFVATPFLIQSLRAMRVKGLIVRSIHDAAARNGRRYYEFRYFSKIRSLLNRLSLDKHVTHRWKATNDTRVPNSHCHHISDAKFTGIVSLADPLTEYSIFEGLEQLPPVVSPLRDIEIVGGGRYAINPDGVSFSSLAAKRSLRYLRPGGFRLIRNTHEVKKHLPVLVRTLPGLDEVDYYKALDQLVAEGSVDIGKGEGVRTSVVVYTHGLTSGGAERQWCNLAIGLTQVGVQVTMVVDTLKGAAAHYLPLLQHASIEVIETEELPLTDCWKVVRLRPEFTPLIDPLVSPIADKMVRLAMVLQQLRPAAVLAQLDSTNIVAGIAGLCTGVPKVMFSFRNYNPSNFSYLNISWFLPSYRALVRSRRVVLTGNSTEGNADYAKWLGIDAGKIHLLRNSIEADEFAMPDLAAVERLRRELHIDPEDSVVLGIFRLSEEKEPLTFVKVCHELMLKVPRAKFVLLGEGPLRVDIEAAIDRLGLQENFCLMGRRLDVPAFLALANVLLVTSRYEGTPNVVMEAQVIGLPVVGTRAGAIPDLVEDGYTGFLADIGDEERLVESCIAVLNNRDLREEIKSNIKKANNSFDRQDKARFVVELLKLPVVDHA